MQKLTIAFPDFKGESAQEFGKRLSEAYPGARIVPVLNGPDTKHLEHVAARARNEWCEPVVVQGQGLLPATYEAYEYVSTRYDDDTIVKIDTTEHPVEKIAFLAATANKISGFAVGDLIFDKTSLVEGTPDWYVHQHTFPIFYTLATKGRLPLSCAHGFQAFAPSVCRKAFEGVRRIFAEVERVWGTLPSYGLDGSMAISCAMQGIPVERVGIPAVTLRNRPAEKIDGQTRDHFAIGLAAAKVFL